MRVGEWAELGTAETGRKGPPLCYIFAMRPLALGIALAVALPVFALRADQPTRGVAEADASVSVLMSLEQLTESSRFVLVVRAVERYSRWEQLAGSRRIVTYTRFAVEETVLGDPEEEVWVRTLGGVVGKIGQSVSGEAQFHLGKRAFVFLADMEGTMVVTGLAQGHFRIIEEKDKPARLKASPDTGKLLRRPGPNISAREVLVGSTLREAIEKTVKARKTQKK